MNAVDLLESQHREVEKLLDRLQTNTTKRHREMLVVALADDWATHTLIEEHQFLSGRPRRRDARRHVSLRCARGAPGRHQAAPG